jgi:hypothetical protein
LDLRFVGVPACDAASFLELRFCACSSVAVVPRLFLELLPLVEVDTPISKTVIAKKVEISETETCEYLLLL